MLGRYWISIFALRTGRKGPGPKTWETFTNHENHDRGVGAKISIVPVDTTHAWWNTIIGPR